MQIPRKCILSLSVALFVSGVTAGPVCAQTTQPLFENHEKISLTLAAPIRTLVNRRLRRPELDGTISYTDDNGRIVDLDVEVRPRGHTRLAQCSFPPLSLNFKRRQVAGTLFEDQNRLKLVTLCKTGSQYIQYLVIEYLIYRIYNELSDYSFRVRPIDMRYVDSDRDDRVREAPAFLIEHIDGVAARTQMDAIDVPSVPADTLNATNTAVLSLFQYVIANTDWSSTMASPEENDCCHNTAVLASPDTVAGITSVPFDFDQSGLVNAAYAAPPAELLGIRTVRQRKFRGLCAHNEFLDAARSKFLAAYPEIILLFENSELPIKAREEALDYIAAANDVFTDPEKWQSEILDDCRG